MKFFAVVLVIVGVVLANGCRHDYNPTPPPYYCQPACGCAPAYTNPCTPGAPTLTPVPANIPRSVPTYTPPANASPSYIPPPAGTYPSGTGTGTFVPSNSATYPSGGAGTVAPSGTNPYGAAGSGATAAPR